MADHESSHQAHEGHQYDPRLSGSINEVLGNRGRKCLSRELGHDYRNQLPKDFWDGRCYRCAKPLDGNHPPPDQCTDFCAHCPHHQHFRQLENDQEFYCCGMRHWWDRHTKKQRPRTARGHEIRRPQAHTRRFQPYPPGPPSLHPQNPHMRSLSGLEPSRTAREIELEKQLEEVHRLWDEDKRLWDEDKKRLQEANKRIAELTSEQFGGRAHGLPLPPSHAAGYIFPPPTTPTGSAIEEQYSTEDSKEHRGRQDIQE